MARWGPTARLLEAAAPLVAPRMARSELRRLGQDPEDVQVLRREAGHILDRPRDIARGFVDIAGRGDVRLEAADTDRWKRIAATVWILRGDRDDAWVPEDREGRYRRLMPQARLIRWEGIGHAPHIEAPERFQSLLEEFLAASGVC
jgi:pimeloyl-ACP methyl ester carboxylesterase